MTVIFDIATSLSPTTLLNPSLLQEAPVTGERTTDDHWSSNCFDCVIVHNMEDELYDEFGNYIGPAPDDDEDDSQEEDDDAELEAAYASRSASAPKF